MSRLYRFVWSRKHYLKSIKRTDIKEGDIIKILVFNIYQHNKDIDGVVNFISTIDPDILLLIEINEEWSQHLTHLKEAYKNSLEVIREDTYGICLYSKLDWSKEQVMYLQDNEVPSVFAKIESPRGIFNFYGLHPTPPIPPWGYSNLPKLKEYMGLKLKVEDTNHPVVIGGDMNDVPWSKIGLRIKDSLHLKDPRVKRGIFGTFPSYFPLKVPLDHIYCTDHFKLIDFKIMDSHGSDHHPVYTELTLFND